MEEKKKEEAGDKSALTKLKNIVAVIGLLGLTTARELALIKTCLVEVVLIIKDMSKLPEELKAVGLAYTAKAKTMTQPQKAAFSSPHLFVWIALCNWALKFAKEKKEEDRVALISTHDPWPSSAPSMTRLHLPAPLPQAA